MITTHLLPIPIVDVRPALREELARLDRLRDRVATDLTIENFKHYIHTSPPADAFALIDRPVDPPLQQAGYAGQFAGQGAREAALAPLGSSRRSSPSRANRRYTAGEIEAAYHQTALPRTGTRVAETLGLRLLTFYDQLYFHGLSLTQLRAGGTSVAYRASQRSRGL